MLRRLLAGLLMALAATAAKAETPLPIANPSEIRSGFTIENWSSFLGEIGLDFELDPEADAPVFIITTPEGGIFIAALSVCDQPGSAGCLGLHLFALFNVAPGSEFEPVLDAFQSRVPFAKAFVTSRGRPVVSRYVIADGGLTKANIFYNLTNFLSVASAFAGALESLQISSSSPPSAPGRALSRHAAPKEINRIAERIPATAFNQGTEGWGLKR